MAHEEKNFHKLRKKGQCFQIGETASAKAWRCENPIFGGMNYLCTEIICQGRLINHMRTTPRKTCLKICKKDLTEARSTLLGALSITNTYRLVSITPGKQIHIKLYSPTGIMASMCPCLTLAAAMVQNATQSRHSSLLGTASESFPTEISEGPTINWSELALKVKPIFISFLGYILRAVAVKGILLYNLEEILSL